MNNTKKLIRSIKGGREELFYNSWTWRKKRLEILDRDNYECQRCKGRGKVTTGDKTSPLIVHHKKELKQYPRLMLEDSNLITVCFSCHNEIHNRFEGRRDKGESMGMPERW